MSKENKKKYITLSINLSTVERAKVIKRGIKAYASKWGITMGKLFVAMFLYCLLENKKEFQAFLVKMKAADMDYTQVRAVKNEDMEEMILNV